jgi:hypothetical protein
MLDAIDDFFPGGVVGLVIASVVGLLALAIYASAQENKRWEAFKVAHNCKVVAHIKGHTDIAPGFSSSGNVTFTTISTPDKTGWACDDGVTYYR